MTLSFYTISNLSIIVAAVIAAVRFPKAVQTFLPFFIFVWLGAFNEIISEFTSHYIRNTNINNNIYVLLESLLLLWQFKCWQLFERNKKLFPILFVAFILFWLWETMLYSKITYVAGYFRIFYSFPLVLMSISTINKQITTESKSLLKNPIFIICMAFIIYFTYKVLIEAFYIYGLNQSQEFRNSVYTIMRFINLFCNLIYAVAILWIPRKQKSLMPS